ncbi:MAG: AP2 domain-containing protein [Candidatus Paceibacteria bacterium]
MENNQKKIILLQDLGMLFLNENSNRKIRYGLYQCFCGKEFKTQVQNIKLGNTKSCGCLRLKGSHKTHNLTHHKIYNVWRQMIDRCSKPNHISYKNYGARGITVCERWLSVANFIEDMFPSFKDGLSLDRINPNGNYELSNCRWATKNVQARNTRLIYASNTSGYRGVSWQETAKKWKTSIVVKSKYIYLGLFTNVIDSAKAYDNYIIENNLEHTKNFS